MALLDKIKKIFLKEDTISYELVVENMKNQIEQLENEYEKLKNLQEDIKNDPFGILKMNFTKKEKYIDEMENIKYEDIDLIKTHEMVAMKYNILIELYKKLQHYISQQYGDIIIDFNSDKFNQPVAILSLFSTDLHKIVLIKNTFHTESYIAYDINGKVEIEDMHSAEPNVNHGSLMMNMLYKTVDLLRQKEITDASEIVLSHELVENMDKMALNFFLTKQNFKQSDEEVFKIIQ